MPRESISCLKKYLPFILEHCGALPYLSEAIGFNGPIYMTKPTKALAPILYEELRKLNLQNKGRINFFSTQEIKNCMKKVTAVELHQSVMVDNELEIKAYYAGHVLGAAMFWIKVGSQTVVYTGDFNMNPDRHLGAASIDKCQPDLLITESTYATENPNAKRCRKEDFLKSVHDCLAKGGKVLIPIFILGRAQELCLILDKYWQEMNFSYPIYFASDSLTDKTNTYYKMFANWTNQQTQKSNAAEEGNVFELKHFKSFNTCCIHEPKPMVVLATNGMLQAGISMQIFKEWAGDEKNLVIFPDVCQKGTLGHKVVSGAKDIELPSKETIKVKLQVEQMNFDAVADANGLKELIEACGPKNLLLTRKKNVLSESFQNEIIDKFKVKCFFTNLGETCYIKTPLTLPSDTISLPLRTTIFSELCAIKRPCQKNRKSVNKCYTIMVFKGQRILLQNLSEALKDLNGCMQSLNFNSKILLEESETEQNIAQKIFDLLKKELDGWSIKMKEDNTITIESVQISVSSDDTDSNQKIVSLSWKNDDEDIASFILYMLRPMS